MTGRFAKATIRPPAMNRTEQAYAWKLEGLKLAGEIVSYDFGVLTLRVGDDCRYTPDFFVVNKDWAVELHEVKGGFTRDDAMVKLKAASAQYPFIFVLAKLEKGEWTITEVKP